MSTVQPLAATETDPRVKAVFDDIRAVRGSDFINNFWLYLAFDPALLEDVWHSVRDTMIAPSALDQKTKEMIYIAVSVANACQYCIHRFPCRCGKGEGDDGIRACGSVACDWAGGANQSSGEWFAGPGRCRI